MKRKTKAAERFNSFGWGLALGLTVALVFATCWGRDQHRLGKVEAERDVAVYAVGYVEEGNKDLRTILTDRQTMVDFMGLQRKVYGSLIDRLIKIHPRQIGIVTVDGNFSKPTKARKNAND